MADVDDASEVPMSVMCTQAQMESAWHRDLAGAIGEDPDHMHRKIWEFTFVMNTLDRMGCICDDSKGLGFAVGKEPLTSWFAARGCTIVATDMDPADAAEQGWATTGQHAAGTNHLNERGLCDPDHFADRVTFRVADMNDIPPDLQGFDFTWSCCALEHLGSLEAGLAFVRNQMRCLAPGGVAVHTTEFNVSSNWRTARRGGTVLFRRRDMAALAKALRREGHQVTIDFDPGNLANDDFVDLPPYGGQAHLKLQIQTWTCTSLGLVIRKRA